MKRKTCLPELGGGGEGEFYLGKRMNEIEHDGIDTCERTEISQDSDNADQNVKWFLRVHKTYKLLWEAYCQFYFFPSFYSGSGFSNFSIFTPPPPPL